MKIRFDHSITSNYIAKLLTKQLEAQVIGVPPNKDTYNAPLHFNKMLAEIFNRGVAINDQYVSFAIDVNENEDSYCASAKVHISNQQSDADLEFVWDFPDEYPRLVIGSYAMFNQIMDALERELEP